MSQRSARIAVSRATSLGSTVHAAVLHQRLDPLAKPRLQVLDGLRARARRSAQVVADPAPKRAQLGGHRPAFLGTAGFELRRAPRRRPRDLGPVLVGVASRDETSSTTPGKTQQLERSSRRSSKPAGS